MDTRPGKAMLSGSGGTVIVHCPTRPLSVVARIQAVPAACAVTRPSDDTLATSARSDDQERVYLAFEGLTTACRTDSCPMGKRKVEGETATDEGVR